MEREIARKAKLALTYRGVDLAGYCTRVEYTDHADSTLDELRVSLEDRERRWQGAWFPKKSDQVSAQITCHDWFKPGDKWVLDCGAFEIGEIGSNGPPDEVTLNCVSVRVSMNARTQKKSKAWEQIDLKSIAAEVAANAGLSLDFDGANPVYDRLDQRNESDFAFLRRLCKDAGNNLKVAGLTLLIFEEARWDSRGPHGELVRGDTWIKNYSFKTKTHDLYKSCVVSFWHPDFREHMQAEFTAPDGPETGEVLRINSRVPDMAAAKKLAKHSLRRKNREEATGEITLVGDPRRHATQVLTVSGYGAFDGKMFVDQVRHTIKGNGAYDTELNLRRTLAY